MKAKWTTKVTRTAAGKFRILARWSFSDRSLTAQAYEFEFELRRTFDDKTTAEQVAKLIELTGAFDSEPKPKRRRAERTPV